ncbi:unnamed protein product [Caenorhabditis sp. 36 PRJEB53466]|nr:unnamed protein product [Caenorhabditis sp. 36 PRJEB53466]
MGSQFSRQPRENSDDISVLFGPKIRNNSAAQRNSTIPYYEDGNAQLVNEAVVGLSLNPHALPVYGSGEQKSLVERAVNTVSMEQVRRFKRAVREDFMRRKMLRRKQTKKTRTTKILEWMFPKLFGVEKFPLIKTTGLNTEQNEMLSKVIHKVTQPSKNYSFKLKGGSPLKPFLMVHQTNEIEIMKFFGSSRLNPEISDCKDVDGVGHMQVDEMVKDFLYELSLEESRRRKSLYEKEHKSLTLKQAYIQASEGSFANRKNFKMSEVVAVMHRNLARIHTIPVVNCREPVIGVPFSGYFKDIVDLPEYPIDLFRVMNQYLDTFGIQIIDLRCRAEDIPGIKPERLDDFTVALEVTHAIVRSADALYSIRHTAKYFIVYAFFSFQWPFRFFQCVVRFKPDRTIQQRNWEIMDGSRIEVFEPPLRRSINRESQNPCWQRLRAARLLRKEKMELRQYTRSALLQHEKEMEEQRKAKEAEREAQKALRPKKRFWWF